MAVAEELIKDDGERVDGVAAAEEAPYVPSEDTRATAIARGLELVPAKGNQLQLDLDSKEAFELFQSRFYSLIEVLEDTPVLSSREFTYTMSESGGDHRHVYVTLDKDYLPEFRIALQLFLGSDPVREILSLKRVLDNDETPIVLFEKPGSVAVAGSV